MAAHTGPNDDEDIKDQMVAAWDQSPYRSVVGLSKDGRPIYSPYYTDDAGEKAEYDPCNQDICNGQIIDDEYAYFSTFFHPYIVGCYGPSEAGLELYQDCSANPRLCNVEYVAAEDNGDENDDGPGGGDGWLPRPFDNDDDSDDSGIKMVYGATASMAALLYQLM